MKRRKSKYVNIWTLTNEERIKKSKMNFEFKKDFIEKFGLISIPNNIEFEDWLKLKNK